MRVLLGFRATGPALGEIGVFREPDCGNIGRIDRIGPTHVGRRIDPLFKSFVESPAGLVYRWLNFALMVFIELLYLCVYDLFQAPVCDSVLAAAGRGSENYRANRENRDAD